MHRPSGSSSAHNFIHLEAVALLPTGFSVVEQIPTQTPGQAWKMRRVNHRHPHNLACTLKCFFGQSRRLAHLPFTAEQVQANKRMGGL